MFKPGEFVMRHKDNSIFRVMSCLGETFVCSGGIIRKTDEYSSTGISAIKEDE